jgi:hypothetical protein
MTASGFVTLTAVVTDSAGASAIKGGTVTNAAGTITYGTFTASSTAGTYTLSLTWTAVNAAQTINFVGEEALPLYASFTDSASHHATRSTDIELVCGNGASPNAACSGACTDLSTDGDCGACGAACPGSATCASPGTCTFTTSIDVGQGPELPFGFGGTVTAGSPGVSCTSSCAATQTGATCQSALATLVDSSSVDIECGTTGLSYKTTSTVSYTADDIACQCDANDAVDKTKTGTCASICAENGFSSCMGVVATDDDFFSTSGAYIDSCTAPYVYANWTSIAATYTTEADGGYGGENTTTLSLADAPVTIGCTCQVAP